MANGRFLSTSIAIDPALAQLSTEAELLYLKTIPHLDRDGLITGQASALLGIISPMRFSEFHASMGRIIDEWVEVGLVIRYGTGAIPVLYFCGFQKNQKLRWYDREKKSAYPAPPGYVRTAKGLQLAAEAVWEVREDERGGEGVDNNNVESGFLVENPDSTHGNPDSSPQHQGQYQVQVKDKDKSHHQHHVTRGAPTPIDDDDDAGAGLSEDEKFALFCLEMVTPEFTGKARLIREHKADLISAWCAYVDTMSGRQFDELRSVEAFLHAKIRQGEPPPLNGKQKQRLADWRTGRRSPPFPPTQAQVRQPTPVQAAIPPPPPQPAAVDLQPQDPLWRQVLEELRLQVEPEVYAAYLAKTRLQRDGPNWLVLAEDAQQAEWLELRLLRLLAKTARVIASEDVELKIGVLNDVKTA